MNQVPTKLDTYRQELLPPEKARELWSGMPRHVRPEVFERNLINALMANPELMEMAPALVYREVAKAAGLGLLLDPLLGEGYLIIAWNAKTNRKEPQLRVGYKGMVKLARQSGNVANVWAHEIHALDDVECDLGFPKVFHHRPKLFTHRGDIVGYAAVIAFKDGTFDFEPMSLQDCLDIRDRSDAWKAFKAQRIKSTPWFTDQSEMCKKTNLRRLMERQEQSPELQFAQQIEDQAEFPTLGHQQMTALPRDAGPPRLSAPEHAIDTGEPEATVRDAGPPLQAHTEQDRSEPKQDPAPKRTRTNSKKKDADKATAKQAATSQIAPYHIDPGSHSFESWATKYMTEMGTAQDAPTVYKWIDINTKRLAVLAKSEEWSKKVEAFTKAKLEDLRKASAEAPQQPEAATGEMSGDDDAPVSDGPMQSDSPSSMEAPKRIRAEPMRDPKRPENFLAWLDYELGLIEDDDAFGTFINDTCAPLIDELDFPPDKEQAQAILRKHEKRFN